ncbi:MAG: helix-turn-helix transcriptional regulator [Candidatus Eisenbacteria bacterium]
MNPKTLGDPLRKRRMDLGLIQREVAERIGVSKDTYRFWECNRAHPLPRQWSGILRFLGYRPSSPGDSLQPQPKAARRAAGRKFSLPTQWRTS